MEIPPESKQTPLPTTAIGFVRFDRAPFHRIETKRLSRADPRPTASKRVHPQFAHCFLVERFHFDAELLQRFGAIGELDGKQDIGRFVDQIAGQLDALGDGEAVLSSGARGDGVARADDEIGRLDAIVLRVLLTCLVFIEPVAAQAKAERKIGGRGAVPRSRRRLEGDFDPLRAGHFAESEAAERDEVDRRVVFARSDADNHQPGRVEAGGRENVERGALGGAKVGGLRRSADERLEIAELSRHGRGRFHVGPDKNHERAALGRGQRPEGDLDGSAHNQRLSFVRI